MNEKTKPENSEAPNSHNLEHAQIKNKLAIMGEATDYKNIAANGAAEHLDHYAKAQGRAGEQVAIRHIGETQGRAVDLNRDIGSNFPIYDAAGPKEVTSVKVRGLDDGSQLRDSTLSQYRRDFEEAVGRGGGTIESEVLEKTDQQWGLVKFNNAARYLHEHAKTDPALPRELAHSPDSAANYLRANGTLTIPGDHATQVQQDLHRRLFSNDLVIREVQANHLGLDMNSPQYQTEAEEMIERVKGMPITSTELKQVMNNTFTH